MATVKGNIVTLSAGEVILFNAPIKKAVAVNLNATLQIDKSDTMQFNAGVEMAFPSLYGYPGIKITNKSTANTAILFITEFGDVINPNYFTDWRT